jgi:hypothetical protein
MAEWSYFEKQLFGELPVFSLDPITPQSIYSDVDHAGIID